MDRRRVVLLDAARYQRDKQEVPICARLGRERPCSELRTRGSLMLSMIKLRTSDHVRELVAPTKCKDDLAAAIVARDEPMHMREYIRELHAFENPTQLEFHLE